MDKKTPKTQSVSENTEEKQKKTQIMHTFNDKPTKTTGASLNNPIQVIIVLICIAFLGIGTGFVLSKITKATGKQLLPMANVGSSLKGKTFGSTDTNTFKDVAEGKLAEGGIEGEGQYHLVRPGGDSQNVYMTSSLVDLSQFIGKKIKVWGETQKARTAGWLMDVGRVEVL